MEKKMFHYRIQDLKNPTKLKLLIDSISYRESLLETISDGYIDAADRSGRPNMIVTTLD